MSATLGRNSYGKSGVRLMKVTRTPDRHEVRDVTVAIQFEGDFEAVHTSGDNQHVLPTDTMKNAVYALARRRPREEIESFARALVAHFFVDNPHVSRIAVDVMENGWERMSVGGWPHHHAFMRSGEEKRTASARGTRDGVAIEAGLADLVVMKTSGSGFSGFMRDGYTTLADTTDRIFATDIRANWSYGNVDVSYALCRARARQALLDAFAEHDSHSVQHTLYAMGEAALEAVPEMVEIRLTLPNRHHLLVDLERFGLDNQNEIFVPMAEPFGLIEGVVRRGGVRPTLSVMP
ncbi:MAG: factor-independent urate hydroxylase [Gemmatimonadaceae bacterium]